MLRRWFDDRPLAAKLGALVLVGASVAGGTGLVSWRALGEVEDARASLAVEQAAGALVLQLDTRSSELKVAAYQAALREDPAEQLPELAEDVAAPRAMLAELAGLPLHDAERAAVADLEAVFEEYVAAIEAYVEGAVRDQAAARAAYAQVQEANDRVDGAVETAQAVVAEALAAQQAALAATVEDTRRTTAVALALGLVLLAAVAVLVTRSVTGPLRACRDALGRLADGDLTARVGLERRDEIGAIAGAVDRTATSVRAAVLTMGESASSLVASSEQLAQVTSTISSGADETSAQAGMVAAAADEVSRNVQTVATGTEQMGASIREIAHNANQAAQVAARAVEAAEGARATVDELGSSSAEIGNVVKVITSIAEQTNLLALNATIEAARAGEAGKGFAVVAGEVKELAQETARATEDIGRRVAAIQSDTSGAVGAIGEIAAIVAQINDYQVTIASAVEEQTATTTEMSRSVAEAATGSTEIAVNISGVAAAATTTTGQADQNRAEVERLERLGRGLADQVARFTC